VGDDIAKYASILDRSGLFEPINISNEDLNRARYYEANATRNEMQSQFLDYGKYLDSLEMSASILPFKTKNLERISQLTNKTNQFNLTTRRYTNAEIEAIAQNPNMISLTGHLKDKFGDNGLISVVIATRRGHQVEIDLWLMSCRVLKRDMELALTQTQGATAGSAASPRSSASLESWITSTTGNATVGNGTSIGTGGNYTTPGYAAGGFAGPTDASTAATFSAMVSFTGATPRAKPGRTRRSPAVRPRSGFPDAPI
jgi:hypothetical protein